MLERIYNFHNTAMGCRQCVLLSVVQLKGKHCRKPHCSNGVVDTFEPSVITFFPISKFFYKLIRFLLHSYIAKSDNEIGKFSYQDMECPRWTQLNYKSRASGTYLILVRTDLFEMGLQSPPTEVP